MWLLCTALFCRSQMPWPESVHVAGSVKDGAWHAHDAILEMLNLHGAGQQKLGSGGTGNFSQAGAAGSAGKPARAAEAAAGAAPGCLKRVLIWSCSNETPEVHGSKGLSNKGPEVPEVCAGAFGDDFAGGKDASSEL